MNGYIWLKHQLLSLHKNGATIRVVGRSVLGRKIYAIEIGSGPAVILQYGIHAREYVACSLAVLHAKEILAQKPKGVRFVLLPMANPDGTELAMFGSQTCGKYQKYLESFFPNFDFRLWKANVRGVDLNNNFDARFNHISSACVPSDHGYKGTHPFSEPETRCLANYTTKIKPFFTLSFHTKGEQIYYDFFQSHRNRRRDKKIAKLFAKDFEYKIKSTQRKSCGGFKDWCVSHFKIPSITVELANDKLAHPISCNEAENLFEKTKDIVRLCEEAKNIYYSSKLV